MTWIDHIIHKAEQEVLDIKAAYINHNRNGKTLLIIDHYGQCFAHNLLSTEYRPAMPETARTTI